MTSRSSGTANPPGDYEWRDELPCFGYGEHLQHLDFKSFREFVEGQYKENASSFGEEIPSRYRLLSSTYQKRPSARPWIFCLLKLFSPKHPCNMRTFLLPSYARLVREAGKSKSGYYREIHGRKRLLEIAENLKAALDQDAQAVFGLLREWQKEGDVSWERLDLRDREPVAYNKGRARQHMELLQRKWKGKRLPSRINDYDSFLFPLLATEIYKATGATGEAIEKEIALAINRPPGSIHQKIAGQESLAKTALKAKRS